MKLIYLSLVFVAYYALLPISSSANDSEGGTTATGGLEFLRNEHISIKSEDLFISTDLIRVEYTYENTHSEDIKIEVAFPVQVPCDHNDNAHGCLRALEFQTWVNGEEIDWRPYFGQNIQSNGACKNLWLQRNAIYNRNGYCFTTLAAQVLFDNSDCRSDGIELNNDDKKLVSKLLSLENQNKCVTPSPLVQLVNPYKGTVDYADQLIDAEDYISMVRTQIFPANSLIKVVHEYHPDVGSGIPRWSLEAEGDLPTEDEWERNKFSCTSLIEYTSAVLHWRDALDAWETYSNSDGSDLIGIYQKRLSYILVTGANWNGPIGHFRLEISTGNRQIVETCFDGLERVSDTSLVFEATDFVPTENLSVTFHAPEGVRD
ncbi:DUF4424 domain-containing protein [Alphaproteobacteria bacterium]|nr:DUF4424 domain-containing protein [Alphaproteobacteria bacterium]